MPQCQAINCNNKTGKAKKSFFQIPDPQKSAEHKRLCKKWIDNLKNGKLRLETFKANKSTVVCEDHFTDDCFDGYFASPVAASLHFHQKRKTLKFGAVPSIVNVRLSASVDVKNAKPLRTSTEKLQSKRRIAELKEELNSLRSRAAPVLTSTGHRKKHTTSTTEAETHSDGGPHCATTAVNQENITSLPDETSTASQEMMELDQYPYTAVLLENTQLNFLPSENDNMDYECQPSTDGVPIEERKTESYVQACGHPCVYCVDFRANIQNDHCYNSGYSVSVSTQTEADDFSTELTSDVVTSNRALLFCTPKTSSTPKKSGSVLKVPTMNTYSEDDEFDLKDLSVLEASFRDDSKDVTFTLDNEMESETDDDDEDDDSGHMVNIVKENKFIVFESALQQLFLGLKCNVPSCVCPVDPDDIKRDMVDGSLLSCEMNCTAGHTIMKWKSQPLIGKMPAVNLLSSASTIFCGQTYTHIAEFARFINLKYMSGTTFHRIQRDQVMPVVLETWEKLQGDLLQSIRSSGRPLRLAGDGRCDSPGFNAKYCTYSVMDLETNQILTYVVVKVTETGSSSRMEPVAFRKCMLFLLDQGFSVEVMATDRHVSIRSIMSKEFKETNHQFDVWHLAKSIKKKLLGKAKLKGAEDLNLWIRAVTNHLWWCASNCGGDKDWLEECWVSIIHHVVNEHSFKGDYVTECQHSQMDPAIAKKKKWLKKGSKAHNLLKEVVLDKRIRKDIRQLSEFCHTGNLEVYHSLMTKYCPKRQEFDEDQMNTRTALAIIDHNMSQDRAQKVKACGEKVYRSVFSKLTGEWVAKPVYDKKNYDWVEDLMLKVVLQKETNHLPPTKLKTKGNIAPKPAPPKSELVDKLKSRFSKTSK